MFPRGGQRYQSEGWTNYKAGRQEGEVTEKTDRGDKEDMRGKGVMKDDEDWLGE